MAMKYWRMTLKGERSIDAIQSAVGESGGLLLRVHVEGGETRAFFAAAKAPGARAAKAAKGASVTEVRVEEVTRIK